MRALYVTDAYFSLRDAGIVHIKEVINNLSNLKNKMFLIGINDKKINIKATTKLLRISKSHILRGLIFNLKLLFILPFYLYKNKIQVIYTRQSATLIAPAIISKIFSIPYITEVNGTIAEEMKLEKNLKSFTRVTTNLENLCYKIAQKVIVTNSGIKKYLIKKYNVPINKIEIIGLGVNPLNFLSQDKKNLKAKLNIPPDFYYIGYTGGLQQWQGIDYLIKSMKIIIEKIPNGNLLIVGDGPEKEDLIKLTKKLGLEKNVSFVNSVKHELIPNYINAMDVCICYLTKFKEGRYGPPTKVYEYMACEKPVILSDIKGVSELFKNKVILAKPENSKDLADKIIYLLKRPKLREKLGKEGRKFVLNGYSWKDVAKQTEKIIKKVIKR